MYSCNKPMRNCTIAMNGTAKIAIIAIAMPISKIKENVNQALVLPIFLKGWVIKNETGF